MNLLDNKEISVLIAIVFLIVVLCLILIIAFKLLKNSNTTNVIKKNNRKTISVKYIACIGLVAAIAVTVGIITGVNSIIEDTNGVNDYGLSKITLDDIINRSVTPNQFFTSITFDGNKSLVSGKYEDIDFDIVEYSAKSLSGTLVLNASKVNNENLVLELDNKVYSGNCRIIVTVDGVYYDEFELNKSDAVVVQDAKEKNILVIVAGEDAECEVSLVRIQKNM